MNREWINLIQELTSKGLTPDQVKKMINVSLEFIEELLVDNEIKN